MDFYYENHEGDIIKFYDSQYILTEHGFTDWALTYQTTQNYSSGFTFETAERSFTVRILPRETSASDREAEYKSLINTFVETISKDTDYTGKLWTTGGEYMVCRVVASAKTEWNLHRNVTLSCTLLSDYPVWIKPKKYECEAQESVADANEYLDYDYGYDYDYMSGQTGQITVKNTGYGSAQYKLRFYGSAVNPYIIIDDITIGVNTTLSDGDYLTIDSASKTVYTTQSNGTVTNQFNNRTKTNSIFEKITVGSHTVIWPGTFGFDLFIYEERREPEWT